MASRGGGAGVACALFLALCSAVPCFAAVYTVNWGIGADYSTWTSGKNIAVGDSLVFNYGSGHTVDEVSGSDYSSCTTGNAISTDSSGATTVPLKTAGTHYFICGVSGHCGNGMKLAVPVAAAGGTTGTTAPATGSTTPSGTPTTTSPAPPTFDTPTPTFTDNSSSPGTPSPLVAMLLISCVAFLKFVLS